MSARARVVLSFLGLAAVGASFAGWPMLQLSWLSLTAPALGALSAAMLPLSAAAILPLSWFAPWTWAAPAVLPTPWWGASVAAGLFALGHACAPREPERAWGRAGLLTIATLALSLAPARGAFAREPWPPAVARALLDLSPTALAMECAGLDWMRHASVYEPVGTDRFERRARRGALAGPTLLLVGYLAAAAAHLTVRRCAARGAPAREG
jgi:hypothetical protein